MMLYGIEHFAEVVVLACLLQYFALEVAEGRVSTARTTEVLVLEASDRILLYYRKYRFVL